MTIEKYETPTVTVISMEPYEGIMNVLTPSVGVGGRTGEEGEEGIE